MTSEQEAVCDRAFWLFEKISSNHRQGVPARNEMEGRIYAELDLDAVSDEEIRGQGRGGEYAEQVDAFNRGGLRAVSPRWLATEDGRHFRAELRQAELAEWEAGA